MLRLTSARGQKLCRNRYYDNFKPISYSDSLVCLKLGYMRYLSIVSVLTVDFQFHPPLERPSDSKVTL